MKQSKFLTLEERAQLEQLCRRVMVGPDAMAQRDALMVLTTLLCGLRASELLRLKQKDLDHKNGLISIRTLKNGVPRELPAPKELFQYANSIKTDDIFPIGYQRLVQIWHVYRPVKKTFHSLRHTFAMRLNKKTRDLKKVQRALGHKSLSSTGVYLEEEYLVADMKRDFGIK